jgi:predicted peroxiredoxin
MKILYMATSGTSDPTKASIPLHLAVNGSLEVGQSAVVALLGDATEIVVADNADRIEGVGLPPLSELITKLRDHEVPVYI